MAAHDSLAQCLSDRGNFAAAEVRRSPVCPLSPCARVLLAGDVVLQLYLGRRVTSTPVPLAERRRRRTQAAALTQAAASREASPPQPPRAPPPPPTTTARSRP